MLNEYLKQLRIYVQFEWSQEEEQDNANMYVPFLLSSNYQNEFCKIQSN